MFFSFSPKFLKICITIFDLLSHSLSLDDLTAGLILSSPCDLCFHSPKVEITIKTSKLLYICLDKFYLSLSNYCHCYCYLVNRKFSLKKNFTANCYRLLNTVAFSFSFSFLFIVITYRLICVILSTIVIYVRRFRLS